MDSPLTALGEQHGHDQGQILKTHRADWSGFDAFHSPLLRAKRTAGFALGPIGKTSTPDDRLKEVAFGEWEGRTPEEIAAVTPGHMEALEADPFGIHFHSPGGETFEDMETRCRAVLSDLKRPAILVCHGITSRVLRGIWLGLDIYGMSDLPGGQGCVYRLSDAGHELLEL